MAYPGSIDSFTANTDGVDDVLAADVNELQTAIVAIETELGTDPAGTVADVKTRLAQSLSGAGNLQFITPTELTISSGAITVTQNFHKIDTEGDAASDDLDTISGGATGMYCVFRTANDARDVVFKHGTGNIKCAGGADFTLEDTTKFAFGIYDSALSAWLVARGSGGSDITTSAGAADSYIAVYTAAGNIEGTDDLQWDGTTFTQGDGTAGRDYIRVINGENNDLTETWYEDEVVLGSNGGRAFYADSITATSEGVAAPITTLNTEVTTNGDSDLDNVTLANGISGQIKNIYCVVEGNAADTWKITPATMCGGTQITFAGVGEGCTMVYADSEGWVVVGNNGGTIT